MNWEELCRSADQWLFRRMMLSQQARKGESIMSQGTVNHMVNGVDVARLGQTVEAVQREPSLAACQFRAVNRWVGGGHNRSTIQGFYGAGEEDRTRADAVLEGAPVDLRGWGRARRNPIDPAVPAVGEEVAAARALSDLAHHLLD